jgi:hypothetical protein
MFKRFVEYSQIEHWILELQRSTACSRAEALFALSKGILDRQGRRLCLDRFPEVARRQIMSTANYDNDPLNHPKDALDESIMHARHAILEEMVEKAKEAQ